MTFEIKNGDFVKDGKPIKIISGAVHYFRNMPECWDDIFDKLLAMGCNCVETYCAWNMHEKKIGEYDFSGILNIGEFIRKAGDKGLMVIVRPGPYICAEWEFGGLPWWILTEDDIEIRCMNKKYIQHFDRYLDNICGEIRPYLTTNGGPVIMVQCENEYGYYGDDKEYLKYLVKGFRNRGIDIPLFTSDGTDKTDLQDGTVEGCLSTLNFGSGVEERFKAHDEMFPDVPKMCMEMWDGWFDAWGDENHHTTPAKEYADTVDAMLKKGSLNMYMFIGGTNFGFTSGANHYEKFAPDVTSYDYDAILTECGDVTEKYMAVREVIAKYTDAELPPIPENRKKSTFGKAEIKAYAGFFDSLERLSVPVNTEVPRCMEYYGNGYGYIAYRTALNRDYENAELLFESLGDRAQIYINKTLVDVLYINDSLKTTFSGKKGDTLTVLCENMGRANFGSKMMRKKGIAGRCLIDDRIHFGWSAYTLPMDNLDVLDFNEIMFEEKSGFYLAQLDVDEPADTFLEPKGFTKGFVTINGFNIGRYWDVGPQKTLYVPAGILKQGANEIVVFESDGVKEKFELVFTDKHDIG